MGMGEPMMNLDAVLAAARRLPDLGVTHRRTTISTVGWLPGLRRFVDEVDEPIRLALSLHAPTDCAAQRPHARERSLPPRGRARRNAAATVELRRPEGLRRVRDARGRQRLAPTTQRGLAKLLDPKIFKVNLIPYNPTGVFDGSSRQTMAAFKDALHRSGFSPTLTTDPRA